MYFDQLAQGGNALRYKRLLVFAPWEIAGGVFRILGGVQIDRNDLVVVSDRRGRPEDYRSV